MQGGWWADGQKESGNFLAADLESVATEPLPSLWRPLPPGRQGTATAEPIVVSATTSDSRNRLATLLHEYAHVLAHFGPVASEKDERQCKLEAESACYVALRHLGIDYLFSRDYLLHFLPLARLFGVTLYYGVGVLLCLLGIIALLVVPETVTLAAREMLGRSLLVGFGAAVILWATGLTLWRRGAQALRTASSVARRAMALPCNGAYLARRP